jgi:hypothetical protein
VALFDSTTPSMLGGGKEEAVRIFLRALFALIAVVWFLVANAFNYRWPDMIGFLAAWPAFPRVMNTADHLLNPTSMGHGWLHEDLPWLLGLAANAAVWAAAITVAVWLVRRMRRRAPQEAPAGA